jgi:DNA-binding transcriptional regulator YiaG
MTNGNHDEFLELYDTFRAGKTWEELEFHNDDFAHMLGVSPRTLYRWKKREVPVPLTAIFLLRLIIKQEKELLNEFA